MQHMGWLGNGLKPYVGQQIAKAAMLWGRTRRSGQRWNVLIAGVLVTLSLSGCMDELDSLVEGPIQQAVATATARGGDYTIEYRTGNCPFITNAIDAWLLDEAITCGYMTVPQDRSSPNGLQIEIAVAIVAAANENPHADPIVYLEGGPGGGAVYDAEWWLDFGLRQTRDIILVDQRGTGYSWPNLGCPELYGEEWADVDFIESLRLCRTRLETMGVDLAAYHSAINAQDLADLRRVLEIENWNLVGVSYGTRLALTVLRDAPEGVRSVVLDSAYPPQVDAYVEMGIANGGAINALLDGCAMDGGCRRAYPDLRQTFYELLLNLDAEPLYFAAAEIEAEDDVSLDAYDFVALLVDALYDTDLIPWLPMLIHDVYQGDYELLLNEFLLEWDEEEDGRQRPPDGPPTDEWSIVDADGMFYAVECYEEAGFVTQAAASAQALALDPLLIELLMQDVSDFVDACAVWLGDRVATEKAGVAHSDIPALILAGEYDPVTPPAWGRLAGETLSNHYFVELPRGGHALLFSGECMVELVGAFLDDPEVEPDRECIAEAVRPWELP